MKIKKVFSDNGIEIPFPTVHVARGEPAEAAIAQSHLAQKKKEAIAIAAAIGEEAQ
jgi:small-conductance mechanosensitive channel